MRILVISLFHAPFNSIASSRVTHYANSLREKGHDVKVICRHFSKSLINSPDLMVGSSETSDLTNNYNRKGDVIYTAFHSKNSILKKGSLLPPGIKGYFYLKNIDAFHYSFVDNGYRAFIDELSNDVFDVIIASSPPLATLVLAKKIGAEFKIPWVADFRDSPILDEDLGRIRKVKIKSINKLMSSAAGAIFVSPGMKTLNFSYYTGDNQSKTSEIIYNGFHTSEEGVDRTILDEFEKIKSKYAQVLLYTGSIYQQRNLNFFLDAIRSVDSHNLAVVMLGIQDEFKSEIEEQFSDLNLYYIPKTTQATSIAIQKLASALLLTIWKGSYTGFSGKVFEYLYSQNHIILDHAPAQDLQEFLDPFPNHHCLDSKIENIIPVLEKIKQEPESTPKEQLQGIERSAQIDKLELFLAKFT